MLIFDNRLTYSFMECLATGKVGRASRFLFYTQTLLSVLGIQCTSYMPSSTCSVDGMAAAIVSTLKAQIRDE
ncbi:MAG: hypothetical protein R3C53_19305 [Pirellulaceae bacterium]